MKYYTHYSNLKNTVFVRYIDDDGKKKSAILPFTPEYFVDDSLCSSEMKTMNGTGTRRIVSPDIGSFRNSIKEYKDIHGFETYGSYNPALQYVVKNLEKELLDVFDGSIIRRLNIDIETEIEVSTGFPSVDDANEVITLITVFDTKRRKYIVFHQKDIDGKSEKFKDMNIFWVHSVDEKAMLLAFLKFIASDYPDIICGWNISNFDIPYLINRMEKILGVSQTKLLSPVEQIGKRKGHDEKGRALYSYTIQGIEIVDSLELYKKIVLDPRESYSLDNISQVELDATKLKHPSGVPGHKLYKEGHISKINTENDWGEWESHRLLIEEYKKDPTSILEAKINKLFYEAYTLYNIIDVRRSVEIEEKLALFDVVYFLAYYSHSNFSEVISSMRFWSNMLYKFCLENKTVFPMYKESGDSEGKFEGAYVRPPLVGRYNGIGCAVGFDVASMYPSNILLLNISPEKLLNTMYDVTMAGMLEGKFPEINTNHALGANGAAFSKTDIGILPKKVAELFAKRKAEKKLAQGYEREINEIENILRDRGVDFIY